MSNTLILIIISVVSYFIGDINWAIIISKLKNKDIRSMGSGNPGTLNMSRNLGLKWGLLTLLLDALKGVVPTLTTFFILGERQFENSTFYVRDIGVYLSGLFVVLGHIYPMFLRFKGGKGIASTIGVLLVCCSVNGLAWATVSIMAMVGAVVFMYITEFGAMGSFIAITPTAVACSIRLFLSYYSKQYSLNLIYLIIANMLVLLICFFTWFAHRKNIERMLAGDEHPTSIKQMVVKAKAKKQKLKAEKEKDKMD